MKVHTEIISNHVNDQVSVSQSSNASTLDHESTFITGNIPCPALRDFDFSLQNIPNRVRAVFDVQDCEFSDVKFLRSGSNATVYVGYRRNKFVAIKMLKPQIKNRQIAIQEMLFEMQILCKVSHPNIITVYGAGESPRKFIMIEYLGGGTLDSLIRNHQLQMGQQAGLCAAEIIGLPWESILPIAIELASALKYLHEDFHSLAMVIHRDLKPQNIGFTADKKLKLFDFGLAVCVKKNRTSDTTYKMTGNTGTLAYMAPEVALRKPYNAKVDVYSFAILLWQMLSGENPFPNLTREEYTQQVVIGGEHLNLFAVMGRAPVGVVGLIERCWHADHTQRPDIATIIHTLTEFTNESRYASANQLVILPKKKRSFLSLRNFFQRKNSNNISNPRMSPSGTTSSSNNSRSSSSGGGRGGSAGVHNEAIAQTRIVLKPISVILPSSDKSSQHGSGSRRNKRPIIPALRLGL